MFIRRSRKDIQSSCKYANPFAEPRATFILVAQFIGGLPFPASYVPQMTKKFKTEMELGSTLHEHDKLHQDFNT